MSGKRVITDETKKAMKEVLTDIQSGKFADKWMEEYKNGCANFLKNRDEEYNMEMAEVGRNLRSMMSFLEGDKKNEKQLCEAGTN